MKKRTNRIGQTIIYIRKFFRIFINQRGWKVILFAILISSLLSAVLSSSMFQVKESTRQGFFAIISACIWIGIFNSIQSICKERDIIKREHRTGLHITSYVAAHMIFQALLCMVQALIMVVIYGIFMDFPKTGLVFHNFFVDLFITFFLVVYASDVLALAVSSIVKSSTTAMTVMPFILIIQLLFSGSVFTLRGAAKTLSDFTISKWGQRVLCIEANLNELPSELLDSEMDMIDNLETVQNVFAVLPSVTLDQIQGNMEDELKTFLYSYTYRKIYEYNADLVVTRWRNLLVFIMIYAGACVISLEFVDKDKR